MGPLDNEPENYGARERSAVEMALKAVTNELKHLQQDLILQLAQDITRLLAEKSRLSEDIEKLKAQQQQIRNQQLETIFQQQALQQQQLVQQMAEMLANQLQQRLMQQIDALASVGNPSLNNSASAFVSGSRERLRGLPVASIDGTLVADYEAIKEEFNSYQTSLNQHLQRLNSLQQQGEIIIERLVSSLIEKMQNQPGGLQTTTELSSEALETLLQQLERTKFKSSSPDNSTAVLEPTPTPTVPPPPVHTEVRVPEAAAPKAVPKKPASAMQVGLLLALASSVVLSLFNVCLKIILKSEKFPSRNILGLFDVQGFITPGFGNSLLILLLRTVVVLLVMPILASFLYPQVWQDLKRFFTSGERDAWFKVVGSGFFLFLSQVLIYIAIGNIQAGIAVTIFFVYPLVTALASWWLFGIRLQLLDYVTMSAIIAGLILAAAPSFGMPAFGDIPLGIATSLGSGFAFAGYMLTAQLGQRKLHPIPFTLIGFLSIFIFCSLSLLIPLPKQFAVQFDWNLWPSLLFGSILLGVLTLASYLLNNLAIRQANAALVAIIGTSGPALTALFAYLMIKEPIAPLQIVGMLIITAAVAAKSVAKLIAEQQAAQSAVQPSK
ncbi:MAG: DMT family transporter [Oscillatoriaceae bacterium SKW80]|nr:DMT family transporter [Oscillatoriaceae bacterium SKYG93]MCX8120134.1 DMT family transporter [Oscillatoriaceae bacterium SKW80]MDW8453060.1 DMT family transporter [Oscillatoriaceae cyanobacterium SKYGB_i_bin93]HIK29029.1 EamA family transporter [Oscillatoriaceae cyanobacterium M7585_C2015_266]